MPRGGSGTWEATTAASVSSSRTKNCGNLSATGDLGPTIFSLNQVIPGRLRSPLTRGYRLAFCKPPGEAGHTTIVCRLGSFDAQILCHRHRTRRLGLRRGAAPCRAGPAGHSCHRYRGGCDGLFFLFWIFGTYLPLRRFHPVQERFGFTASEECPSTLTGVWRGHPVRIHYHEFRKSRRARLSISILIPHPTQSSVLLHREGILHRVVKSVGLTREAQTADPIFNRRVFVESDTDEIVPPLVTHPGIRSQVLALLRIRRSTVGLDMDGVGITIAGHLGWRKYFRADAVQEILSRLLQLAEHTVPVLRDVPATVQEGSRASWEAPPLASGDARTFIQRMALLRHPARLAIFIAALLFFLGPALTVWGARYQPVTWRLHLLGLGVAGGFLLAYTFLVFAFVRGHSQSHRYFSTFMFAALVGFPTFWVGALKVTNGLLDPSSPFVVEGQVLGHVRKKPRLEVRIDLPNQSGAISVRVSMEQYRTARPGMFLPIVLSSGALGEPWVVRAALVEGQR